MRVLLTSLSLFVLMLSTVAVHGTAEPPDLSGEWELNELRSEDPREMMMEQRGGRGGSGGGGGRGGGSGGFGGGRGGAGRGGGSDDREAMRERMRTLHEGIKTLTITHLEPELTILYADDRERSLLTDGRELTIEAGSGFYDEKAKWKGGNRLVVKGESSRGGKLTQTFELSEDGANLFVTTETKGDGRMPEVSFLRVYDRVETEPATE